MKKFERSITIDILLFFLSCLLLAYSSIRAYKLSFTYDESWTYLSFVLRPFTHFKNYTHGDTNNHLLNTWLMELCVKIFGASEFSLRLPNILAHSLFLFYSAKLVRKLSSRSIVICAFVLLNLNPFLLDFFSLVRGYGLSIGLLMASLYYAYKYINENSHYLSAFLSMLFITMAVFAYFSIINFMLILAASFLTLNILRIINEKEIQKKFKIPYGIGVSIIILLPLFSFLYIIPVLNNLKKSGSMDFGGNVGFWKDTVKYLLECLSYKIPPNDTLTIILQYFVALILLLTIGLVVYMIFIKKMRSINLFFVFLGSSLFLSFIATIVQNKMMKIPFPQGRYAFIYLILFVLLLIFLLEQLHFLFGRKIKWMLYILTTCCIVNFVGAMNFNYVHDWSTEGDTKDMINYLDEIKKNIIPGKENISIGAAFQWNSDVKFYRVLHHLQWLNQIDDKTTYSSLNDYYYIGESDSNLSKINGYKILKKYPESKTLLLQNIHDYKSEVVFKAFDNFDDTLHNNHHPSISKEHPYSGKYCSKITDKFGFTPLLQDTNDVNLLNHKRQIVQIKAMIYADNMQTDAQIVITQMRGQEVVNYYAHSILEMTFTPKKWSPICATVILPEDIKMGDDIKAYIWNFGHHDLYVDDLEMKIIGYEEKAITQNINR